MVARTVTEAVEWLEENNGLQQFMLWVDMWDPHEPFDPPSYDWDRYRDPGYGGDKIIYPAYGRPNYMTADEHQSVRALYAGKITLVDRWVGRLLEKIDMLGLTRDTLIVWTTDHGHLFGEHDLQGKPTGELGNLYEETTRIPLIVRHPEGLGAGQRVSGLVQPPDLAPSILDFLKVPVPDQVQGRSFWPLVRGDEHSAREAAFSARFSQVTATRAGEAPAHQPGDFLFDGSAPSRTVDAITVTTERWAYICSPTDRPSELYDLEADPRQGHNVAADHPEVAEELRRKALEFLEQHGASEERLRPFKEGGDKTPLPLSTRLWGFRDDQGLWVTFIDQGQAEQSVSWEAPGPRRTVEETTFGAVLDDDPKSLVRIGAFYWAEDLL
jgi:arylsulfatase A-like enzyme